MPLQYLIEILDGAVVIEVVEVIESCPVQCVIGTKRYAVPGASRLRECLGSGCVGQHQRQGEQQMAMGQGTAKQMGIPLIRSSVLSLSDARAVGALEPRALLCQDICLLKMGQGTG